MYAPEFNPPNLPYALLNTEKRAGGSILPSLTPNTEISFNYRTVQFHGSTSQAVAIYMPADGCLRVLDPARGDAEVYANLPIAELIPLSDPSRIIVHPEKPAAPTFLPREAEHTWCYYFTKAELAFQAGDFTKVITLESQALSLGHAPVDLHERLLFIEARALSGDIQSAQKLSGQVLRADPKMRRGVCSVWKRIQATVKERSGDSIAGVLSELKCP